jgi:hypothetical protein
LKLVPTTLITQRTKTIYISTIHQLVTDKSSLLKFYMGQDSGVRNSIANTSDSREGQNGKQE